MIQPPTDLPQYLTLEQIRLELWMRGELEFLLWPQQIPIWRKLQNLPSHVVEFVILCGRQFGKSTIGVAYALSEAIQNRDCCILIVGPDINQTVDIVGPKMRFLTRTAPPGLIVPMASRNRYHVYHDLDRKAQDYTEIVIAGMNENSSSQRGKTVHRILIEEIVDVPEQHFITSIRSDLGPALLHSDRGKIVYLTTPPKYPHHPFVTETLVQAKLDDALSIFTLDDNIALTPEQKSNAIKLAGGRESVDCRREYYCEIVRDPRVVCLPDFQNAKCVRIFGLPNRCFMQTTIDWGGVRDKTVALLHTYDYLQNKILIWDERVFEPNTGTATIVRSVLEMEKGHEISMRSVDAPPQLLVDLNLEFGFQSQLPQKDDWQAALNNLNKQCGSGEVWIHPRCKFFIVSCESGILNRNKTDFDRNDALGHMDGVATGMYAVRMQNRENPFTERTEASDWLQQNQIPPRDEISRAALQYETVTIPRAFGRHRQ